jgi:Sodium/hydrogen exchanger family
VAGRQGKRHAILPAFILGLAVSRTFAKHRAGQQPFRVVAFALLTPFFFLRSGMNLSLPLVYANAGLLLLLLGVELAAKSTAVYPLARRYARDHAPFTTLLMTTGLTVPSHRPATGRRDRINPLPRDPLDDAVFGAVPGDGARRLVRACRAAKSGTATRDHHGRNGSGNAPPATAPSAVASAAPRAGLGRSRVPQCGDQPECAPLAGGVNRG